MQLNEFLFSSAHGSKRTISWRIRKFNKKKTDFSIVTQSCAVKDGIIPILFCLKHSRTFFSLSSADDGLNGRLNVNIYAHVRGVLSCGHFFRRQTQYK